MAKCTPPAKQELTHGWITALLMLEPSLFYAWLHRRNRDLALLVLGHVLSNLEFIQLLAQPVATWLDVLR